MLAQFRELWCVDFEYHSAPGGQPTPVCLVARELRSDRVVRLWRTDFQSVPPYPTDRGSLFIAYHASAETGCHLALGWPLPEAILDLEAEFRCATTNVQMPCGKGLVGAMVAHGLSSITATEKSDMIGLILRGGHSADEREAILKYCQSDVDALAQLLPRMLPDILARPHGLELAVLRGLYSGHAVAAMEHNGTPIDCTTWSRLQRHWREIKARLVAEINPAFAVYDGLTFKAERFAAYLCRNNLPWPQLASGELELKDKVFKEMGEMYPQVEPLRQLRHTLSQLRLSDLAIGDDGRNRCMLGQFVASSGRNAPKASQYIFGPSTWLRGLIKPKPGRALAYIDWSSQEIGIAAALSGDTNLMEAATSRDPYIYFAKMAKLVPEDATKNSHKAEREMCKRCMLGVNYGMRAMSLSFRISKSVMEAQDLLQRHRQVFPKFWAWSEGAVRVANLFGHIDLTFGWRVHDGPDTSPLSLQNAPMQGNGAEMMRLAAIAGVRRGVQIDAVLHDAFLIESDADRLEDAVTSMQAAMAFASNKVLGGLELKTDVNRVCWPGRYMDSRPAAESMWNLVTRILTELEEEGAGASTRQQTRAYPTANARLPACPATPRVQLF